MGRVWEEDECNDKGKLTGCLQLGLIVIKGIASGEVTVQCSGKDQQSRSISSRWGFRATGLRPWNNSPSFSFALMLSTSLSPSISRPSPPLFHTELIRENKRAELISAGLPGESEAKSAIISIFIHPTPPPLSPSSSSFVLLGAPSQRSLSGWESKDIKTCTHTQC